ncbi:MAG: hypothetical protein ACOC8E_08760 [Planctomycetota bacterium]
MREISAITQVPVKQVQLKPSEAAICIEDGEVQIATGAGEHHFPARMQVMVGTKAELEGHIASERLKKGRMLKYRENRGRDIWAKEKASGRPEGPNPE